MYEFPYGGEQQLNLNWIINEIITLHKRLDPDYELPNFDNAFPYMNLNQLNLDWILRELKTIKDLAPSEDAQLLKMVANALIANTYDAETQYNIDDIIYRDSDNRLYKCVTATPAGGEPFDSTKWVEIDVGGVLTDLLNSVEPYDGTPAMNGTASAGTSTQYARGDHVHPKDTARVPTTRTVNGKALSSNITLNASDIPNDSNVAGDNTDDALNNCVTNVRYNGGFLKKTINGADVNIIQVQDTPTNDSAKLPSSKAVYNANAAIAALTTEETGTISKSPTITTGSIDSQLLRKVGNVVNIGGRIYGMTDQVANDTFFTISENCRPNAQRKIMCVVTKTDNSIAVYYANVNANGNIGIGLSNSIQITQILIIGTYPI